MFYSTIEPIKATAVVGLLGLDVSIPLFGAVAKGIMDIVTGAEEAMYNKIAARHLSDRCQELGAVLGDMFKTSSSLTPSLEMEVKRLLPLLDRCRDFIIKFGKRNYLSRLLRGSNDAQDIRLLDKEITDVIQSISLSLGVQSIAMNQETLKKLDKLDETSAAIKAELEAKGAGGGGAGSTNAPQLDPSGPAVSMLVQELGVDMGEVRDQIAMSLQGIKDDIR